MPSNRSIPNTPPNDQSENGQLVSSQKRNFNQMHNPQGIPSYNEGTFQLQGYPFGHSTVPPQHPQHQSNQSRNTMPYITQNFSSNHYNHASPYPQQRHSSIQGGSSTNRADGQILQSPMRYQPSHRFDRLPHGQQTLPMMPQNAGYDVAVPQMNHIASQQQLTRSQPQPDQAYMIPQNQQHSGMSARQFEAHARQHYQEMADLAFVRTMENYRRSRQRPIQPSSNMSGSESQRLSDQPRRGPSHPGQNFQTNSGMEAIPRSMSVHAAALPDQVPNMNFTHQHGNNSMVYAPSATNSRAQAFRAGPMAENLHYNFVSQDFLEDSTQGQQNTAMVTEKRSPPQLTGSAVTLSKNPTQVHTSSMQGGMFRTSSTQSPNISHQGSHQIGPRQNGTPYPDSPKSLDQRITAVQYVGDGLPNTDKMYSNGTYSEHFDLSNNQSYIGTGQLAEQQSRRFSSHDLPQVPFGNTNQQPYQAMQTPNRVNGSNIPPSQTYPAVLTQQPPRPNTIERGVALAQVQYYQQQYHPGMQAPHHSGAPKSAYQKSTVPGFQQVATVLSGDKDIVKKPTRKRKANDTTGISSRTKKPSKQPKTSAIPEPLDENWKKSFSLPCKLAAGAIDSHHQTNMGEEMLDLDHTQLSNQTLSKRKPGNLHGVSKQEKNSKMIRTSKEPGNSQAKGKLPTQRNTAPKQVDMETSSQAGGLQLNSKKRNFQASSSGSPVANNFKKSLKYYENETANEVLSELLGDCNKVSKTVDPSYGASEGVQGTVPALEIEDTTSGKQNQSAGLALDETQSPGITAVFARTAEMANMDPNLPNYNPFLVDTSKLTTYNARKEAIQRSMSATFAANPTCGPSASFQPSKLNTLAELPRRQIQSPATELPLTTEQQGSSTALPQTESASASEHSHDVTHPESVSLYAPVNRYDDSNWGEGDQLEMHQNTTIIPTPTAAGLQDRLAEFGNLNAYDLLIDNDTTTSEPSMQPFDNTLGAGGDDGSQDLSRQTGHQDAQFTINEADQSFTGWPSPGDAEAASEEMREHGIDFNLPIPPGQDNFDVSWNDETILKWSENANSHQPPSSDDDLNEFLMDQPDGKLFGIPSPEEIAAEARLQSATTLQQALTRDFGN